jgi:hypothetical protein
MGVKLINQIEGERLQDIAPVVSQEEEAAVAADDSGAGR